MKQWHKKTLLIVEDNVLIALVKQKDLEDIGYNVLIANSGDKAVELFIENEEIDLILMDIDLGCGIDGIEAAEIIMNNRAIPVVFMSSYTELEIIERAKKISSYEYVVKNSCITDLNDVIERALSQFQANNSIL